MHSLSLLVRLVRCVSAMFERHEEEGRKHASASSLWRANSTSTYTLLFFAHRLLHHLQFPILVGYPRFL